MDRGLVIGTNVFGMLFMGVGFFALPWLSLGSLPDMLRSGVGMLEVEQVDLLINIVDTVRAPTGWQMATEVPTIGGFLQIVLFVIPLLIPLAGVTLFLALNSAPQAAVLPALIQGAGALLLGILLFLFSGTIRVLGLDPGIFGVPFSLAGVAVGMGFWMCIIGLLVLGAGGFMIPQMEKPRRGDRRRRR
jgi:hypothetical protein